MATAKPTGRRGGADDRIMGESLARYRERSKSPAKAAPPSGDTGPRSRASHAVRSGVALAGPVPEHMRGSDGLARSTRPV